VEREVALGVEAADQGEFGTATLDELKQQAIARFQAHRTYGAVWANHSR